MKILVDKLPQKPEECPESIHRRKSPDEWVYTCRKSGKNLVCEIGSKGFNCPHYREMKAYAGGPEYNRAGDQTGYTYIPIHLED